MARKSKFLLVWEKNGDEKKRKVVCTPEQVAEKASKIMDSDDSIPGVEVYKGHIIDPDKLTLTHGRAGSTLVAELVGAGAGNLLGYGVAVVGTAVVGPTALAAGCVAALGALVWVSVRGDRSR